jgi:YHS domain-containing protein
MNRLRGIALLLAFLTGPAWSGIAVQAGGGDADSGVDGRLVNDLCPVATDEFASPAHELQFHGVSVRFCCDKCQEQFRADPAAYLSHLPQLSPAGAQRILDELHTPGRDDPAQGAFADRTSAAMLAAATVLAGWVVVRRVRRARLQRSIPPPRSPGAPAASA